MLLEIFALKKKRSVWNSRPVHCSGLYGTQYILYILLAETSADGKKKDKKYPGYFGGCREDLPGQGGPWAFPNDCKDYTVSRDFLGAFLSGHGKKVEKSEEKNKLNTEYFYEWIDEINATKDENCTENENIEFKYDYKVEMCYCKNEKDQKTPCNGKAETIGVSKSGVATLALTIVLLAISIIGIYERVLKEYFD